MQNNNQYKITYNVVNECSARGACSISPAIVALEELSLSFLQQIAYYMLKLENFGANNKNIKIEITQIIASMVSVNEFSENQLYSIILKEYYILQETLRIYSDICKKTKLPRKLLNKQIKFNEKTNLSKAIALGEKIFFDKYQKTSTKQKNFVSILIIVLKSVSLNLIKLNDFGKFNNNTFHELLEILNLFNSNNINSEILISQIDRLSKLDNGLQDEISQQLISTFGEISKVKVSHSTRKGKAILVSGNNFFDLMAILEDTKDKNIDIYTHSNLLITHALSNFQKFDHLKGHYGDTTENCILDFATFPGAILLTKNSRGNSEYFYRGRLFSNDYIVPDGVIKLSDNNYEEVIESALNAKGFSKGKIKNDTNLGFNKDEILIEFENICKKVNNGDIKRLYIIGFDAHSEVQKEYFKDFFSKLNNDEFVISFSYESFKDNVLTINVGNYVPIAMNVLKLLFNKLTITDNRITFFFTTCDVMTISGLINLKNLNAKNIYMSECSPTLVNPSVYTTLCENYNIKTTTTPENDLKNIRI